LNDAPLKMPDTCGGAGVVTFSVTFTVCGLLPAPELLTVTVPWYVPAASPVGITLTLIDPGVLPLVGVTCSQLPPDVVVAAAFHAIALEPLVVMLTVCAAGFVVATVSWAKVRAVAESCIVAAGLTVNVTGTRAISTFDDEMMMLPVYDPVARPDADAEIVIADGRLPDAGVTDSQFPPEVVVAAAVNGTFETLLLSWTVVWAAVADPAAAARVAVVGFGVTVTAGARFRVTGTFVVMPAPVPVSGVIAIVALYVPACGIAAVLTLTLIVDGVVRLCADTASHPVGWPA
jgi:hypothetical protein